jgi:hypothetical protein
MSSSKVIRTSELKSSDGCVDFGFLILDLCLKRKSEKRDARYPPRDRFRRRFSRQIRKVTGAGGQGRSDEPVSVNNRFNVLARSRPS